MGLDVEGVVRVLGLPGVISVGEEDRDIADLLNERIDGNLLLGLAGNGLAVGITSAGPAGLEVDDILARANLLQVLDLVANEGTGLRGAELSVKEWVKVGTKNVNDGAEGVTVAKPGVNGFGGGNLASVTSGLEGRGSLRNEASKFRGRANVAGDSLVTDGDESDKVPLSPAGDFLELRASSVNAISINEDTNNHLQTVGAASSSDVLEGVAVGSVNTNVGESLLLDKTNLLKNIVLGHAASVAVVGGEGHAHLVPASTGGDAGGRRGGGGGAARNSGSGRGSGGGRNSRGGGQGRDAGRDIAVGVRANIDVLSASHGDGGTRVGVSARGDGLRGGVDNNGGGRDVGGGRGNGVGTSRGADVGGGLNNAGDGAASGLDGGIGAGDGRGGLDNGGDTTVGVGTAGELSGGGAADSGGVGDGDGGSRDGVGTSLRVAGHAGGGESDLGGGRGSLRGSLGRSLDRSGRGSRSDRDGAVAGRVNSLGGLRGHGAGRNREGDSWRLLARPSRPF